MVERSSMDQPRGRWKQACYTTIRSTFWKAVVLFATVLLLFGSPLQFMFFPKTADLIFDGLFSFAFAIFIFDMVLNIAVKPDYLPFNTCWRRGEEETKIFRRRGIGSFMFWCDLVSSFAMLHDISYINARAFARPGINIKLDNFGVPLNFGEVNNNIPLTFQPEVLVNVIKAARIARLIPSSAVVDISSKINFYWYLQRCNPLWHWNSFKERRNEMNKQVGEGMDLSSAAKLKAQGVGIKYGRTKKALHYFGLVPDPNRELKRHLAAIKIQSAWRWRNAVTRLSSQRAANTGEMPSPTTAGRKFRNFSSSDIRAQTQVGRAMAEITGQRLAITILASLLLTLLFTYIERNATYPYTMVILHGQTVGKGIGNSSTFEAALGAARRSSVPSLFEYRASSVSEPFEFGVGEVLEDLREREKLQITVEDKNGTITTGLFVYREQRFAEARVRLMSTILTCIIWFLGVTAFAGPIMTLVITPIERMVRLLGMLTLDPLGYQTNSRFKKFMFEEDAIADKSQWTKDVLKGMETAFLMSTILQIGNLMKVGFGSAGVEIIRNNLQKGQNSNMLILNEQGSTVSCIFLYCDIRQFTDATECLQEEVFVFTNRIAAVVHSICHAYGGSANKNIGDAFLVSWQLEDDNSQTLTAKHQQADKALLSVVKICMALQYDDYYVKTMSENARTALLKKLRKRPGPIVQMGFGLHAGKAVQGAIGSQRKIDATYVSEAVEKAEFLESSTKQYGLKMLMSNCFHALLDPKIQRRCRKIDQVYFPNDEDEDEPSIDEKLEMRMELCTFDMDPSALWKNKRSSGADDKRGIMALGASFNKRRGRGSSRRMSLGSMRSVTSTSEEFKSAANRISNPEGSAVFEVENDEAGHGELVLPTGIQHYKDKVWLKEDIRLIREKYTTAVIQDFNSGLQRYYDADWANARRYFEMVLERFDDGPSNYFLEEMKRHDGKPPQNFSAIRRVD